MRRALLGMALLACAMGGASCGQSAATAMATQAAVPAAVAVAQAVPEAIQSMVDALVTEQQPTWGKPQATYITPDRYVILYPTPEAERKQGRLRMVVVNRVGGEARIERMRQKGF